MPYKFETTHIKLTREQDRRYKLTIEERELIKALHKNRIEAAISGDLPALYWSNKLDQKIALAAVHSNGVLVMRLRKEHHLLLPQINAAIAHLKADGTINAIIDKYTKPIVRTQ